MATLSSTRLYDLIERFLYPRRSCDQAMFDFEQFRFKAVSRLVEDTHPSAEKADDAWLQRIELRSSQSVITMLECFGLQEQRGVVHALFVDGRCGLIRCLQIRYGALLRTDGTLARILEEASNCHADGIILATNDLDSRITKGANWAKLVSDLYHKGEAIGIFLLDHFVLTKRGWSRVFTFDGRKRR